MVTWRLPTLEDTFCAPRLWASSSRFSPRRPPPPETRRPCAKCQELLPGFTTQPRGSRSRCSRNGPEDLTGRPPGLDGQGRRRPTDGGMGSSAGSCPARSDSEAWQLTQVAVEPLGRLLSRYDYPATLQAIDDSQPPGRNSSRRRKRLARRTPPLCAAAERQRHQPRLRLRPDRHRPPPPPPP